MRDSEPEPVTIASIENITKEVEVDAQYNLPLEVEATMSDNSKKNVAVTWEPSTVDTSKVGTVEFTGTVEGFDGKVKLTLTVKEKELTVEEVKAAFLQELETKVGQGTAVGNVSEVNIDGENITVTFNEPKSNEAADLMETIEEVYQAAEGLVSALKEDVEGRITINNKEFSLDEPNITREIAELLLGEKLGTAAEKFLVKKEKVNALYTAEITKGEVTFTLNGNLVFTVAK